MRLTKKDWQWLIGLIISVIIAFFGGRASVIINKTSVKADKGSQAVGSTKVGGNLQMASADHGAQAQNIGTLNAIVLIGGHPDYIRSGIDDKTLNKLVAEIVSSVAPTTQATIPSPQPMGEMTTQPIITPSAPPSTKDIKADVEVVSPSAIVTRYSDAPDHTPGLAKASLFIPFINIGNINANNLKVKWHIVNNGQTITAPDEYFKVNPTIIENLPSGKGIRLTYRPDISPAAKGTIKLVLDYEYINSATGEKISKQYKGSTDYEADQKDVDYFCPFSKLSD